MADRSIVVKFRADVSDLTSKLGTAKTALTGLATQATQVSQTSKGALSGIGVGLGKGLDKVDKHSASLNALGTGFGVLGVAAAAGVGVAVKSFADFDEAISHVAASGKDAQANIGFLRQAALQAGADTKFSATEAAGGVEALLKAGVSAQDVLGGGLSGALDLAASGNLSVADSAEAAATAMTQFGLKGADVPHIADLLAAGAGKAQGEVSDMAAALNQSGLVASQFGISIEDTVGSLTAFAAAGLQGSDSGTSFKTMLQRLANPSDEAANEMKRLGINVYDAQGQFVGMTSFAEQLKTKLGGLTDAQRNASLAIIGGADAVRPLNVLYKEGGAGISNWVSQVNDAGYAAETAGKRMDNLKGDFEQFTGSLQTGLIQSGSGANSLLRDITQNATKAANAFGQMAPESQKNVLTFAAIAGGSSLAVAGLVKVVTSAASAKAALDTLGVSGTRGGAALGAVGKALGVVAVAFGVAEAAGLGFDAIFRKNDATSNDAGSALVSLGQSADFAGSGLDNFFSSAGEKYNDIDPFTTDIDGLSGAIDRLFNKTDNEKAGDFISGWLPGMDQAEVYAKKFSDLDGQLVKLSATGQQTAASGAFAKIAKQFSDQGVGVDDLIATFPRYKAALQESANQLGVGTLSAQDYADWMGGKVPAAIQKAAKDNPKLAASLDLTSGAAAEAVVKLQSYSDALLAITSAAGAAESAVDSAASTIKKNGKGLDQNTKKGRENQGALDNVAGSAKSDLGALAEGGASQGAIGAAAKRYRKFYRDLAVDAGMGSKAARALANDLISIPNAKSVRIVTPGAKVSANEAAILNHELKSIPKEQRAKVVTIAETKGAKAAKKAIAEVKAKSVIAKIIGNTKGGSDVQAKLRSLKKKLVDAIIKGDTSGARQVKAALDALHDKTVVARVVSKGRAAAGKGSTASADGGYISGFAGGGPLRGRGGPREDNVMGIDRTTGLQTSWVSVGEFVTNARSYANNRDVIEAINANPDKRFAVKALAKGGPSGDTKVSNAVLADFAVVDSRDLKELTSAQKALDKSTKKLTTAQSNAAAAIKEFANGVVEPYRSKSNDVDDVLEQLKQGAVDVSAFGTQIKQLKALGLNQNEINDIVGKGAVNGGELAAQIIAGGKGLVDSLNAANKSLEQASITVGAAATGAKIKGHAFGGLVTGAGSSTSDSNLRRLSNGEFVVQAAAAKNNLAFLQAFNRGAKALPSYALPGGSATTTNHSVGDTIDLGDIHLGGNGGFREARRELDRRRDIVRVRKLNRLSVV